MSTTIVSDHDHKPEERPPPLNSLDIAFLEMTEAILNKDLDEVKRLIVVHEAVADFSTDDSAYARVDNMGFFLHRRQFPELCPLQQFAPKIYEDIADDLLNTTYLFLVSWL